jgi:hypothetical protein
METSLHRQLKQLYAERGAHVEVPLDSYRIDVICDGELIEIQHGSLAAIRRKVLDLLRSHRVLVVKPIIRRKRLVKRQTRGGKVVGSRMSPKRGTVIDLFDELIYFTRVFPHRNLVLDVPLVDVEEWRHPGHGGRRRWRRTDHQVEDQRLLAVHSVHRFRTPGDLLQLVPHDLPDPFHTGHLAAAMDVPRSMAQRIAYCLRHMGAVSEVGKKGNARLYSPGRRAA